MTDLMRLKHVLQLEEETLKQVSVDNMEDTFDPVKIKLDLLDALEKKENERKIEASLAKKHKLT